MSNKKDLGELITDNKENAEELSAADKKRITSEKNKIEKKISKLILSNKKNSEELSAAYKIIATQKKDIKKQAADLIRANKETEKHKADLVSAKKELAHKAKLIILNKKLNHQIEKNLQTDQALKESNKKYSEAFKSAPYSITIARITDGKFIEVNDAFTTIFGFTSEEAINNSSIGLDIWVNIEDRKWVTSTLLDGRVVSGKEFLFKNKDGEIITCLVASRFININKEPFIISSIDDITDRKQAENLLKESEQKSMSIMENSADAIFITNQQGKYIYTNKEASVMLGYTSEEMINKTIADISPQTKIEEYYKILKKILNEGKGFAEIELIKKDGSCISSDLNAVLLPDGTLYASCRDITIRKHTEFELIKAKEKAEESDRLKSAFLTNMSHEIRTPMNGILGFAELLKEPNLTIEEQQDYIQTMQISGARMLNTINSIVDISKIESGLIGIDIKGTNLNEKIEFTYKFFKPEVEIKGLQFLFKNGLPTNEAIIKTDNEKVYGILTNLVRNAIKFTFDGSIEFGYVKKGEYLEFFVKDTGIGIPQKQQQLIFERFRQGSESHDRGYEGSGLGLSISKSYVEMLGGRIWVESEEGLGSTFYFTIPYIAVSEEKATIENFVSAEHKEVQLKNLKILIVEDDEISYSLLSITLQKISKEVLHVITGVQAIEACRNNPDLDLILMDIRMLQMNGLEATQQIRQFNKDVIIIAQTAYGFSGDREKAIEAGCNDYISKPINMTLLFELIKKHVNKDKK
jgi:PAS domain S-box-containing protein